jgi:hypothetical protein
MIDAARPPTSRQLALFGLLWLLFFGLLAALSAFRPAGLRGAAAILGTAWLASLAFNREERRRQLLGLLLPALCAAAGTAGLAGASPAAVAAAVGGLGAAGAAVTWLAPAAGSGLYRVWLLAAVPIGWTMSRVVLGVVYYAVLTPVGLLLRLFGRDPMERGFDPSAGTYWVERKTARDPRRYFRQF